MSRECKFHDCPLHGAAQKKYYMGSRTADILLVDDSPAFFGRGAHGRDGHLQGDSGEMMKNRLQQYGINWREMFIATATRCVLDKRALTGKEVTATLSNCRHFIESVIYQVKPKVIFCAGDFAFRQVMKKSGIKKNRGQWFWNEEFECWVIATLHPNFIMRNMAMEAQLIEDIRMLSELVNNDFQPPVVESNSSYREITSLSEMHRPKRKPKSGTRMVRSDKERPMGEDWADFLEGRMIGLDTEGQGLDWANPEYIMISYSLTYEAGTGYNVTFYEECDPASPECVIQWQQDRWVINEKGKRKKEEFTVGVKQAPDFALKIRELAKLLLNEDIKKALLNGSFDFHVFRTLFRRISKVDIPIRGYAVELQILAHLTEENIYKMASLEQLQKSFTNIRGNYNTEFGNKYEKGDMIAVPQEERTQYACADTDVTFQAYNNMMSFLKDRQETEALHYYKTFAMPTIHTLFEMEETGAYVDKDRLPIATKEVALLMEDAAAQCITCIPQEILEKDVHQAKGIKFTRDALVRDILFSDGGYGLRVIKRTKAKEPSIDKNVRKALLDTRLPLKARTFLENLETFKMYHTLWSRYLRGFKKAIKSDGRIHTRYGISMAVTGRVNCLTGDTLVSTLGPKGDIPIKEVQAGEWVWAFDDSLSPVPAQVSWSGKTHENAEVYKITYQTQGKGKIKSIRCTGDHPFRLRDGSYVEASKLEDGMRVLSLERSSTHGYRRVHATGNMEFTEHIMVSRHFDGENEHVHHKDENQINNYPDNLKSCTSSEHRKLHPRTEETNAKSSRTMRLQYALGERKAIPRMGKDNPNYYHLDPEWAVKVLHENCGRPTAFRDIHGLDYTTVMLKLKELNIDWQNIRDRFRKDDSYITDEELAKACACTMFTEAKRILNVSYPKAKRLLAPDSNHMIISVRKLNKTEDVYDITVSEYHNFIANGVNVHNSSDPNLMNIPKRGPSARIVRSLIAAKPGYILMAADESQSELRWLAHQSNDPAMIKVFRSGEDIHTATGKILSGAKWDTMDKAAQKKARQNAKPVNFGLVFGMSAKGFVQYAKQEYGLVLTIDQAESWMAKFFSNYKRIKTFHRDTIDFCRRHGYVISPLGRKRRLPEINSNDPYIRGEAERQAINHPVQSPSSDVVLMAANEIRKQGHDPKIFRPILFIHDELVFEVKVDVDLNYYAGIIKKALEHPPIERDFGVKLSVPLLSDVTTGPNLADMKDFDL